MGRPRIIESEFKCNLCKFSLKIEGKEKDIINICNVLKYTHNIYCPECGASKTEDFYIKPFVKEDYHIVDSRKLIERELIRAIEVIEKGPKLKDIIGNKDVKELIRARLVTYSEHKDKLIALKKYPSSGIILAGIQGTAKTDIVTASVNDVILSDDKYKKKYNVLILKSHHFMSGTVGESGKKIEAILNTIRGLNKETKKETILVIDEIDNLLPDRDTHSVLTLERTSSFLSEFGGLHDDHTIFIMGTTNKPEKIDSEALVSRRFGNPILVNIPTDEEKIEMFKKFTSDMIIEGTIEDEFIITHFNKYSGRDISDFVTDLQTMYFEKERNGEHNSKPIITYDNIMNLLENLKYRGTPERNSERLNKLEMYYSKYDEDVRGSDKYISKSDIVNKYINERLEIVEGKSEFTDIIHEDYLKFPGNIKMERNVFSRYILNDGRIKFHRPKKADGKQHGAYLNVKLKNN